MIWLFSVVTFIVGWVIGAGVVLYVMNRNYDIEDDEEDL